MIRPEAVDLQAQKWWTCTKHIKHWSRAKLARYVLEYIRQQGYFMTYDHNAAWGCIRESGAGRYTCWLDMRLCTGQHTATLSDEKVSVP